MMSEVDLIGQTLQRNDRNMAEGELDGTSDNTPSSQVDLTNISSEDWEIAQSRYNAIRGLLKLDSRTSEDVERVAKDQGIHETTIYRWIAAYQDAGHLSALISQRRGPKKGSTKLSMTINEIIDDAIETVYLTKKKQRPPKVIEEVNDRCDAAGIAPPHPNTVRNRIKKLPQQEVVLRRQGRAAARDKFAPIRGQFPDGDFPLSAVQIDHTEADVIVVDEEARQPIGRPWITLAIDVHTRMIAGVYVSLDRPSAIAVGLCLSRAMLEKSTYLEAIGVEGQWPVFGQIRAVYADNAKEFRGKALERACAEHGLDTVFRPVLVPHYGGHIERMIGTTAGEIRTLDGATFSSPKERGEYNSVREATMSLKEFEAYLVDFLINKYHRVPHSALGVSPLSKWRSATTLSPDPSTTSSPPIPVVVDPERLLRDFMPFEERTVQRYGVSINGVKYFDEVLTPWIGSIDPDNTKAKRKFTFRYDPRNLASVWFFDPQLRKYFEIPYRNLRNPAITIWELRQAKKILREQGRAETDEVALFETIRRLKRRREDAKAKTLQARRSTRKSRSSRSLEAPMERPGSSKGKPAQLTPEPVSSALLHDLSKVPIFDD